MPEEDVRGRRKREEWKRKRKRKLGEGRREPRTTYYLHVVSSM